MYCKQRVGIFCYDRGFVAVFGNATKSSLATYNVDT